MQRRHRHEARGFIALIAVIMASLTMLAFSLIASDAAAGYSDMVDRRELRIQAGLNAEACLDTASLMLAKARRPAGIAPSKRPCTSRRWQRN